MRCSKTFCILTVLGVGLFLQGSLTNLAFAAPILPPGSGGLVQTRTIFNQDANVSNSQLKNEIVNGTSHAVVTTQSTPDVNVNLSSSADLTKGEVKAFASSEFPTAAPTAFSFSNATVDAFDIVTFNLGSAPSTTISYNFSLDGSVSNADPTDAHTIASGGFFIFDITGQSSAFTSQVFSGNDTILRLTGSLNGSSPLVAFEFPQSLLGTADDDLLSQLDPSDYLEDSSGSIFPFNFSNSGTFEVFSDRVYGFQLFANAIVDGQGLGVADVSNTGSFRFTDLGGATFSSASGGFLTNVDTGPAPVPEPSTMLLMGSGLVGLIGWQYRKKYLV